MIGHQIVEDFDIEEKLYDLFCNILHTKEFVEFYLGSEQRLRHNGGKYY